MITDSLHFDRVRADDPSVTDPDYVDVAADALPGLNGGDFWWEELPPSSEFPLFSSLHFLHFE